MKHRLFNIVFLLLWVNFNYGQGKLLVEVKSESGSIDHSTGRLIGLTFQQENRDSLGKITFSNIPFGSYTLEVTSKGYLTYRQSIDVYQPNQQMDIVLVTDESELDEIVVTGTLKEQTIGESAIKIDLITPKLFQKNPTPNLFQALNMVNGVKPQINCNVCNTGDIHINGMEGPYTMILIDGMPIVSGLSTVYGLMGIPNSIVERIEIMKGPGGALYGSEAMGGIINVITKNAKTAPRILFDQQLSSWMESNTDIAFMAKPSKNIHTLISANYFRYNQKADHNLDGFTDLTLQNRLSLFNKWNFDFRNQPLLSLAARYVYENRWGGQTNWTPDWRGSDSIYGESIYTNRMELISSLILPVKEKLILQTSYNYHYQDSYYGTSPYLAQQHIGFSQFYWDKKINNKHSFVAGYAFRYQFYDDNTPVTQTQLPDNIVLNNPDNTIIQGLFYQHQLTLRTKHTLIGGIRIDYEKEHQFIPSPRLAWKYQINETTQFRINGGTGFRVVNLFTEDHMALTGARKVVIQEDLKPEQSQNLTLHFTKRFPKPTSFILVDAGAFYTIFSNRIIADYDTDPTLVLYENLNGKAITRGVNLNVEFTNAWPLKLISGLTFSDVTYQQADSTGQLETKRQLFAPTLSGNFVISYTHPKTQLSIDITGNWYSPQRLPVQPNDFRPEYSPWFGIVNLQLKRNFKSLECYAGIKNLLNFVPQHPIMRPEDPFNKNTNDPINNPNGYTFDPSYNYASLQGLTFFVGLRLTLK